MPTELTWRPHTVVSALHAAEAIARKQTLADPRLAQALQEPVQQLAVEIRAAGLLATRFWNHLIPLAALNSSRRQLVETVITKTQGRGPRFESVVTSIEGRLAAVEKAAAAALPNLTEDLELRQRPLREQWEARGPGLLWEIGRLTEESLIVPSAEVLLVHPALGGGGESHLPYNSVRLEAMLANPVAELPEVVRLAWLLSQLQLDLPMYSEAIHADRLVHVARYATLPAALIAAEAVELVRFAPTEISRAITTWHLSVPKDVDAAAIISEWWQTYQEARPPWGIALAALDQMFG
jgi:hypothetical protein